MDAMVESACARPSWRRNRGSRTITSSSRPRSPAFRISSRSYRMLGERSDYPLHLGLTEAGWVTKGVVASTAGLSILLQEGIGDTIRVSLTRARRRSDRGSAGGATGAPITRHSQLHTTGHRMSRVWSHNLDVLSGDGGADPDVSARSAPRLAGALSRLGGAACRGDGCVVNGPGESKHADIGISLPGTAEERGAPVYVDGALKLTLRAIRSWLISCAFSTTTSSKRFGGGGSANRSAQRHVAIGVDQTDVPPQESRLASALPKKNVAI